MVKTRRKFNVTWDKTRNLVTWVMEAAENTNTSNIQKVDIENMRIVCIPGKTESLDKYMVVRDQEFAKISQILGKELANIMVLIDSKDMVALFQRAELAAKNRQKSALLKIAYNIFKHNAERIEQDYDNYRNSK